MDRLETQEYSAIVAGMGRRRKASLWGGSGQRIDRGRRLPGYYVRYSDYPGGRRVYRSKHFLTLRAAREWVKRYNARQDLKEIGQTIPIGWDDAVDEFSVGGAGLSFNTARSYGITIGLFRDSLDRQEGPVCDIQVQDVERFLNARLAQSSSSTVAKHLRNLHVFFNWAVKRGYASHNPAALVASKPKSKARKRPEASEVLLERLIAEADTEDRRLALQLAMTLGLDRGQIERLAPEQIDRDSWVVSFVRGKTGKPNVVPLPAALIPAIARRLDDTPPGEPLLKGLTHQKRSKDWWTKLRARAGAPSLMFRDLRAVASTRLQKIAGASLKQAQTLLGHGSIVTTASHYQMPDPDLTAKMRGLPVPGFPPPHTPTTATPPASGPSASEPE